MNSEYGSDSDSDENAGGEGEDFRSPTIRLLNPELYDQNIKESKIIRNHQFETLKHIRER